MPRIELQEYQPAKPVGILPSKIVDMGYYKPTDPEVPKMKNLIDPENTGIIVFHVLPDGHEKIQMIYVPIKVVFKDGKVALKDSKGVIQINKLCESLGLQNMGFAANGTFVDEGDDVVQADDIVTTIFDVILKQEDFRVLVHVYKEKTADGKQFFRTGLNMHMLNEMEWAEKAAASDLDYQSKRNGSKSSATSNASSNTTQASITDSSGPTTPGNTQEESGQEEVKAAQPKMRSFAQKRL